MERGQGLHELSFMSVERNRRSGGGGGISPNALRAIFFSHSEL